MSKNASSPYNCPDFDFQQSGLLFQFVLEEFLQAATAVRNVSSLRPLLSESGDASAFEQVLEDLTEQVFCLVAPPASFPWYTANSPLGKLHEHSLLLCSQSVSKACPRVKLATAVDKSMSEALKCQQWLSFPPISDGLRNGLVPLDRMLDRLEALMDKTARYAMQVVQEFDEDENVLYYIIRHYNDLKDVCGDELLEKTMERMYPKGLAAQMEHLTKRYIDRGFEHLVPEIEEQLSHA